MNTVHCVGLFLFRLGAFYLLSFLFGFFVSSFHLIQLRSSPSSLFLHRLQTTMQQQIITKFIFIVLVSQSNKNNNKGRILKSQIWTLAVFSNIIIIIYFFSSFSFRFWIIMGLRTREKNIVKKLNKNLYTQHVTEIKHFNELVCFFLSHWQQCRCNVKQSKQDKYDYTHIYYYCGKRKRDTKDFLKEEIEIYDRRFCSKLKSLSTQPMYRNRKNKALVDCLGLNGILLLMTTWTFPK